MVTLDHEPLKQFVFDTFVAIDAPEPAAEAVATSLVEADLRGHGSHGVMRVPNYVDWVLNGNINPTATPDVLDLSESCSLIDGNCAFGQYVGRLTTEHLVDRTRGGIAVGGIRNGSHLGRLGEWAERTASQGLLFAGFTSGTVPTVAPAGTAERRFSTNPIAFGVPTFDTLDFPIVLDMATSQTAHGKIRERVRTGESIPDGWTVSTSGEPVRDARAFQQDGQGALRPLGAEVAGHKGYGLAVIVELFASFVGDAKMIDQEPRAGGNAAAFIAIDPLAFSETETLQDRLASFAAYLDTFESASGVSIGVAAADEVGLFPGEREHKTAVDRANTGIPLADEVAATLVETAHSLGIVDSLPYELRKLN